MKLQKFEKNELTAAGNSIKTEVVAKTWQEAVAGCKFHDDVIYIILHDKDYNVVTEKALYGFEGEE